MSPAKRRELSELSLCCTPETTVTSCVNRTSIKKIYKQYTPGFYISYQLLTTPQSLAISILRYKCLAEVISGFGALSEFPRGEVSRAVNAFAFAMVLSISSGVGAFGAQNSSHLFSRVTRFLRTCKPLSLC